MSFGGGLPPAGPGGVYSYQGESWDGDPRVSPGLPRPVGWRVRMPDGTAAYDKFGTGDTQWVPVGSSSSGGGTISDITSVDGSVSIADPTGPTADLSVVGVRATWPLTATGFFACDGTNGNDANAGFSTVSQAAAGVVAVKSIARLLQILPKFGGGRLARVAIRAGNYASDTAFPFTGYTGYKALLVIGTDTIASAGSVAFAGDANDTLCAGMTTATGMNVAGYNPTAYAVAADGTPTATLQLAGGGAPGFAAAPARPYGARLRFDSATGTAALRNFAVPIILAPTNNTVIVAAALPANPTIADICYIEMPNVTGPTSSDLSNSSACLAGLSIGNLSGNNTYGGSEIAFAGVDAGRIITVGGAMFMVTTTAAPGLTNARTGYSLHSAGGVIQAAEVQASIGSGWTDTGAFQGVMAIEEPSLLLWEASAAKALYVTGGAHAGGSLPNEGIGTNLSTAHGATCQVWGTATFGGLTAGLQVQGGYAINRVKCSNAAANPAIRIGGAGLGVAIVAPTGSVADGNTDVGLDLSGNVAGAGSLGSTGCQIIVVPAGQTSVTGSNGDVRLPNGQIVSWASLIATGMADSQGNRFASTSGPTSIIKFSGALATSAGGATSSFLSDNGPFAPEGGNQVALHYPTSARLALRLRVTVLLGTSAVAILVTLIKNGVATAMTISIPAGSAAGTKFSDLAHPILFADGDDYDLEMTAAADSGSGGGPVSISAGLEWAT